MSIYSYVYIFSNPCSEADSNNNNNGNNKKIINLYLIFLQENFWGEDYTESLKVRAQ